MNRVNICGLDTSSLPKLTAKQSEELLHKIASGDERARSLFIQANMRLVLSVVGRFSRAQENADDLFQVGMVGLLKALNNFDISVGVQFSTYAVPMIIGEIKRSLRDRTGVKVSRSMRDTAYQALKAREKLQESNNNIPELYEIAEEIGIPLGEVACALDAVSDTVSFYEPIFGGDDEEGMQLLDQIDDKRETAENWSEKIALSEALKLIPDRELSVIKLRYFEGKTQTEISQIVGISQAQVSRMEKSAIAKLREELA